METERRWLATLSGPLPEAAATTLWQRYLTTGPTVVRVRTDGTRWWQTVKATGATSGSRPEVEFEIPAEAGGMLWGLTLPGEVHKTRYRLGGWEIDVFHGAHEGLLVAEIELPSLDTPLPPLPPGVHLGAELTHRAGWGNANLVAMDRAALGAALATLQPETADAAAPGAPASVAARRGRRPG